jgi:hypothetical protein
MTTSERQLESRFINLCRKYKVKTIKGDSRNNVGFPDRIVFNTDTETIHYVEFKNDTYYKQTIPQGYWQDIIEASGGRYFLINGENEMLQYVDTFIKRKST